MSRKRRLAATSAAIAVICCVGVAPGAEEIRLKVTGAKMDCVDVPVCTTIELPAELADTPVEHIAVDLQQAGQGRHHPGQLVQAHAGKVRLWWILPRAEAGQSSTWIARLYDERLVRRIAHRKSFSWRDKEDEYLDLLFDGRKVTRYMYAYDDSTAQRLFETYKPFHHVYDAAGRRLTNGPDGGSPYIKNEIKYPHHRGIFIGWSRLTLDGNRYDLWHMSGGAQVHQEFMEQIAGPVLARSTALIHWNDKNEGPLIAEQRQTTVFRQSDPTLVLLQCHTKLKAVRGDVFLNGDPEHAGFQYRAHNDFASGPKQVKATYLFHEDGIDPRRDKNLPWVAMSYGLDGRRYSVQHLNHPDNPEPAVYSAYRDYGRFGAFFKDTINDGETSELTYRICVVDGEMPGRQELTSRYAAFVDCPQVEVLSR